MSCGAGFSFYVPDLDVREAIICSRDSSPFSVELMAIREAAYWICENFTYASKFVILSDCLDAVKSIKNVQSQFNTKMAKEILQVLMQAEENGHGVTLGWIPGHVGIPGNEKADGLAKIAAYGEKILEKNIRYTVPPKRPMKLRKDFRGER